MLLFTVFGRRWRLPLRASHHHGMLWVTSGSDVTLTVEGNEVKASQVIDALISNGKVEGFYVYERVKQDNENGL